MPDTDGKDVPGKRVTNLLDRAKKHPVVIVFVAVVAVVTFVLGAMDGFTRLINSFSQWRNPHAAEYSALESLDLDTRPEYFEDNFGRAKKSIDLCRDQPCTEPAPKSLYMYIHESKNVTVRAIFEDDNLAMYAVTLKNSALSPRLKWLGYDLGRLGDVTFAQALAKVRPLLEPTDAAIHLGPRSAAYAEVFAVGAPGRYRGLLLASAAGGHKMMFDPESGDQLQRMQVMNVPQDPAVLASFRSNSSPNTYGEFRDDGGYMGKLLHKADRLIALLYVGTEQ